ncbi:MAG TPA: hypothetical protein VFK94_06700 [Patescibacteria group bacterium]|nr:hypothetical protein [Patescibacteria group bacterium]
MPRTIHRELKSLRAEYRILLSKLAECQGDDYLSLYSCGLLLSDFLQKSDLVLGQICDQSCLKDEHSEFCLKARIELEAPAETLRQNTVAALVRQGTVSRVSEYELMSHLGHCGGIDQVKFLAIRSEARSKTHPGLVSA